MVCLEGKWEQGRAPLNALPRMQQYRLSEQDDKLLRQVESLAGGVTPPMIVMQNSDFAALLPLLVDHPRTSLGARVR